MPDKTVIEMARESGFEYYDKFPEDYQNKLKRFAALVREDERESIYKTQSDERLMKMPEAGSDDDTDKAAELVWHLQAQIESAVLAERERCKAVLMAAHELSKQHHNYYHYMALQLDETAKATAIRARGAKCL